MIEDVGSRLEHCVDVRQVALEVGHQDFDGGLRIAVTDGADRGGPDAGPAVGELIAGHAGDHDVAEIHAGHGIGHPRRFAEIQLRGPSGLDGAEVARPGTDVAEDHYRGGAARPAFAKVGALRALADGMQTLAFDQLADGGITRAVGQPGSEPGGFALGLHPCRRKRRKRSLASKIPARQRGEASDGPGASMRSGTRG